VIRGLFPGAGPAEPLSPSGWCWRSPAALACEPWLDWLATRTERPRWFIQTAAGAWQLGLGARQHLDPRDPNLADLPAGLLHWPCWLPDPGPESGWGDLARPGLILPAFLLEVTEQGFTLSWHPEPGCVPGQAIESALEHWLASGRSRAAQALPRVLRYTDSPRADWDRGVRRVLDACETGTLEKAVLGCWREIELDSPPDALDLLRRMPAGQATRLLLQSEDGTAFLALTPERLYHRQGPEVSCDALAGTRPAGQATATGAAAAELAASPKDRHEQALVVAGLEQGLSRAGLKGIRSGPVSVSRAGPLLHLRSRVEGIWNTGQAADTPDDRVLVRELHPSPALGGRPREQSLALLARCESFERGLYGGLVGSVGPDRAELWVGIRCARLRGSVIRFYAGAGLVPGSDPEGEWQETRHKLAVLQDALA
jgi:menaquinone-specific isochorismate synthase